MMTNTHDEVKNINECLMKSIINRNFDNVHNLLNNTKHIKEVLPIHHYNTVLLLLFSDHEYALGRLTFEKGIINFEDCRGLEKLFTMGGMCSDAFFTVLLDSYNYIKYISFYTLMSFKHPHLKKNKLFCRLFVDLSM